MENKDQECPVADKSGKSPGTHTPQLYPLWFTVIFLYFRRLKWINSKLTDDIFELSFNFFFLPVTPDGEIREGEKAQPQSATLNNNFLLICSTKRPPRPFFFGCYLASGKHVIYEPPNN